ncbi:MAG: class I SAM-dependent methyltransferase [Clostridia bacterium]|nr:class I SAM-dependent methyltransferase [Clostridia bacterium]
MDVRTHYDLLIEENNDPVRDPQILRNYMDRWDGEAFLNALNLDESKTVLEIGIGTGRLALRTAPLCKHLTGIDLSPKTVQRAKENLKDHKNLSLICADFNTYAFRETFDVVYSSLTLMHFENKDFFLKKASSLLKTGGIFCLSIDKSQNQYLDMGSRKVRIFPDDPDTLSNLIGNTAMEIRSKLETEAAFIFVCKKKEL